ncbi:MAG: hypothetical protein RLZZ214_313 [Verrucomicrobiota bacterium]
MPATRPAKARQWSGGGPRRIAARTGGPIIPEPGFPQRGAVRVRAVQLLH